MSEKQRAQKPGGSEATFSSTDFSSSRLAFEKKQLVGGDYLHKIEGYDTTIDRIRKRVEDIKTKPRSGLSIADMFELARVCPEELDGLEMENKIRDVMQRLVGDITLKQAMNNRDLGVLQSEFKVFQQKYTSDTRRVSEIPNLNTSMQKLGQQQVVLQTQMEKAESELLNFGHKVIGFNETNDIRFNRIEQSFKELDKYAHRPVDYYERIQQEGDSVREALQAEMQKMIFSVNKMVYEQSASVQETQFTCEKIDKLFQGLKVDTTRHETLCYELATKFDEQHHVLMEFVEQIESFKTYALVNDLHMEAYLPMQMASVAYQVGMGLTKRETQTKYDKHFTKTVLKSLKKNMLSVCDPKLESQQSPFSKMHYELPDDLGRDKRGKVTPEWEELHRKYLEKMSLGNIHLFHDQVKGKSKLLQVVQKNDTAENIVRMSLGLAKEILLTERFGPLTREALVAPLQSTLEQMQRKNFAQLKTQLNASKLIPFHEAKMSTVIGLLDKSKVKDAQPINLVKEKDNDEVKKVEDLLAQIQNDEMVKMEQEGGGKKEEESDESSSESTDEVDNKKKKKRKVEEEVQKAEPEAKVEVAPIQQQQAAPVIIEKTIEKQIITEIQYVQAPAPVCAPQAAPFQMNVGVTLEQVHKIVNESKGGEREAVDTLQILLEEKIENTDDSIDAYKTEMTDILKEMNKKIREEINTRECTQRSNLLDKIQSVFTDVDSKMENENEEMSKKIAVLECQVAEHAELIEIECMEVQESTQSEIPTEEADETEESVSGQSQAPQKKKFQMEDFGLGFSHEKPANVLREKKGKQLTGRAQVKKEEPEPEKTKTLGIDNSLNMFKSEQQPSVNTVVKENQENENKEQAEVEDAEEPEQEPEAGEEIIHQVMIVPTVTIEDTALSDDTLPYKTPNEPSKDPRDSTSPNPLQNASILDKMKSSNTVGDESKQIKQSKPKEKAITKAKTMVSQQPAPPRQKSERAPKAVQVIEPAKENTDVTMQKLVDKTLSNQKMQKVFNRDKKEGGLQKAIARAQMAFRKVSETQQFSVANLYAAQQERLQGQQKDAKIANTLTKLRLAQVEDKVVLEKPLDKFKKVEERPKPIKRLSKRELTQGSILSNQTKKQGEGKKKKRTSSSGSAKSQLSGSGVDVTGDEDDDTDDAREDELREYLKIQDFELFKSEMYKLVALKEQDIIELRSEQQAFLGENIKLLEKVDKVDWTVMRRAETLTTDTLSEFKSIVKAFEQSIKDDFQRWRHKNANLQGKYENVTLWVKMITQINKQLQQEFFNSEQEIRKNQELIAEYLKMQIAKDFQDEVDKESFGLIGIREQQLSDNKGGPVSGSTNMEEEYSHNKKQVELDRKCLNCTGTTGGEKGKILSYFKMACLNYKPSPVTLPNTGTLQRNQVTGIQQITVKRLVQELQNQTENIVKVQHQLDAWRDKTLEEFEKNRIKEPRFLQHNITQDWNKIMTQPPHLLQQIGNRLKKRNESKVIQTPDLEEGSRIFKNRPKQMTAGLPSHLHANPNWGQGLMNSQTSESLQGYSGGRQISQEQQRELGQSPLNQRSYATIHRQQLQFPDQISASNQPISPRESLNLVIKQSPRFESSQHRLAPVPQIQLPPAYQTIDGTERKQAELMQMRSARNNLPNKTITTETGKHTKSQVSTKEFKGKLQSKSMRGNINITNSTVSTHPQSDQQQRGVRFSQSYSNNQNVYLDSPDTKEDNQVTKTEIFEAKRSYRRK